MFADRQDIHNTFNMKLFTYPCQVILTLLLWPFFLSGQSQHHRMHTDPIPVYGDADHDTPDIRHIWLQRVVRLTAQHPLRSGQKFFVDSAAVGLEDGSSWSNAYPELQDALLMAGAGDTIWVAKGTYYAGQSDSSTSFIMADGLQMYGGFDGIETHLDQRNPDLFPSILSGDMGQDDLSSPLDTITDMVGTNSLHVVFAAPGSQETVLDGFTLTAGSATGALEQGYGGGLMSFTSLGDTVRMTIRNCVFRGNQSSRGGGVGIRGIQGKMIQLEVYDSRFVNNHAITTPNWPAEGAAIECFMNLPKALMNNRYVRCAFEGNSSALNGGSVFHREAFGTTDHTQLLHCLFDGNRTTGDSPGFTIFGDNQSGTILVDSCQFVNNHASAVFANGAGVAILINNGSDTTDVTISNSLFDNNHAFYGGGIGLGNFKTDATAPDAYMSIQISNCLIQHNISSSSMAQSPAYAGGLDIWASTAALDLTMSACSVAHNTSELGAGMSIYSFNSAVVNADLLDCQFVSNQAEQAAGGLLIQSYTEYPFFTIDTDTATLFAVLDNCDFVDNESFTGAAGLGLEIFGNGFADLQLSHSTFEGNDVLGVGNGGGLGISQRLATAGNVIATIDSCHFEDNLATRGGGMAVDALLDGFALDLQILATDFVRNSADIGGGIYLNNEGGEDLQMSAERLRLLQDSAGISGGGLAGLNQGTGSIMLDMETSVISGTKSNEGAGVYIQANDGEINSSWINNTFVSNTAEAQGGAMVQSQTATGNTQFTIVNSILWDNAPMSNSPDLLEDGATGTVVSNIFQDSTTTYPMIIKDPLFVDLIGPDSMPGSGDENFQLREGSPAINAGINSFVTSSQDLAGNERIQNDTIDFGAYESPYFSPPDTGTVSIHDPIQSPLDVTLYPNPAHESVYISYTQARTGIRKINLLTATGQEIWRNEAMQPAGYHQDVLTLEGLATGVYVLVVEYDNRRGVKKLHWVR